MRPRQEPHFLDTYILTKEEFRRKGRGTTHLPENKYDLRFPISTCKYTLLFGKNKGKIKKKLKNIFVDFQNHFWVK